MTSITGAATGGNGSGFVPLARGQSVAEWLAGQPGEDRSDLLTQIYKTLRDHMHCGSDDALEEMSSWLDRCGLSRWDESVTIRVGYADRELKKQWDEEQEEYDDIELFGGFREPDGSIDLVEGVMPARASILLGGPEKGCKTTLGLHAAFCLATGVPFLGQFKVNSTRRVLYLSGETNADRAFEILDAMARRQGLGFALDVADSLVNYRRKEKRLLLGYKVPNLTEGDALAKLAGLVNKAKAQVVFIDPAYMALGPDANAASLNWMGNNLRRICDAFLEYGRTPVLVAHTNKAVQPGPLLKRTDMNGAGYAEQFRAWLLVNRRVEYDVTRPGENFLNLAYGGAGFSGAVNIDLFEFGEDGKPDWRVEVSPYQEQAGPGRGKGRRRPARRENGGAAAGNDQEQVLAVVRELLTRRVGGEVERKDVRAKLPTWSSAKLTKVLASLEAEGKLEVRRDRGRNSGGNEYERHLLSLPRTARQ